MTRRLSSAWLLPPNGSWTGWGYLTAEAQRLVKEGRPGRGPTCSRLNNLPSPNQFVENRFGN